jgi:hypothetical protein
MRLGTLYEPSDEQNGGWSHEQLVKMNDLFCLALESAFKFGLENRASAAGQVKLPVSQGPRFVTALCPATCDGLFRSAATDSTVFVARG